VDRIDDKDTERMSDFLFTKGAPQRGIICNRTLNLRSVGAMLS
jgi:hypothetical protein